MNKSKGWGGKWTEDKLEAFSKYVAANLRIMKANHSGKPYTSMALPVMAKENKSKKIYINKLSITQEEQQVYKCSAKEYYLYLKTYLLIIIFC